MSRTGSQCRAGGPAAWHETNSNLANPCPWGPAPEHHLSAVAGVGIAVASVGRDPVATKGRRDLHSALGNADEFWCTAPHLLGNGLPGVGGEIAAVGIQERALNPVPEGTAVAGAYHPPATRLSLPRPAPPDQQAPTPRRQPPRLNPTLRIPRKNGPCVHRYGIPRPPRLFGPGRGYEGGRVPAPGGGMLRGAGAADYSKRWGLSLRPGLRGLARPYRNSRKPYPVDRTAPSFTNLTCTHIGPSLVRRRPS